MGGKKKRSYLSGGEVFLVVGGIDDMGRLVPSATDLCVEAGSRLSGFVVVLTPQYPHDPTAMTTIKLKSKYNSRWVKQEVVHTADGQYHTEPRYYSKQYKWWEHKSRFQLFPGQNFCTEGERGMCRSVYPFELDVPENLCDSMKEGRHMVMYTIRVKVAFDGFSQRLKSKMRAVDIVQQRPKPEDLCRTPKVMQKRKRNMLVAGNVKVEATTAAHVCMQGKDILVKMTIHNDSSKVLNRAELEVEGKIATNIFRHETGDAWYETSDIINVVKRDIHGLEILPGTTVSRNITIRLPKEMDPPTTFFVGRNDHSMKVTHTVQVEVAVPGQDVRIKMPIHIAPDISKLPLSRANPPLYPEPRLFVVRVISASNLPRMDGRFGKADPFVTVLVNDRHFHCTTVIKSELDPTWNEECIFYLSEDELAQRPRIQLQCFDYDRISADDLIGDVVDIIRAEVEGRNFPMEYELTKTKKGTTKSRGTLTISYDWL